MAYRVLEADKFIKMDKTIKEQDKLIEGLQAEIKMYREKSKLLEKIIETQ